MDLFRAFDVVDGFDADATEAETLEAWRAIDRSGLASTLPGRYGRTLADLRSAGILDDGGPE